MIEQYIDVIDGVEYRVIQSDAESDNLLGGVYNDYLLGGYGNDTLWGEGGNDILDGYGDGLEYEFDTLTGGAGADTFVLGDDLGTYYLGDGDALITDFNSWEGDRIEVFGDPYTYGFSSGLDEFGTLYTDISYGGDLIATVLGANDVQVQDALITV